MGIDELYRQGQRAAVYGGTAALLLGVAKLTGGWLGHSSALIADAVHSLGDVVLAVAIWGALRWAQHPADLEHPYGHARAEGIAGLCVALMLVLSTVAVGWESAHALVQPEPEPHRFTLAVAAISLVVNETLHRRNRTVARRLGSTALEGVALDQRLDALTAMAVLVALVLACYGGPAWRAADPVAGIFVAGVILVAGGRLGWTSLHELMDAQAEPELLASVRREALSVTGVMGVEKLHARKVGLEYLVDIHVEVDGRQTVQEGHAIAHAVKDKVLASVVPVKNVLVHIEPSPRCR